MKKIFLSVLTILIVGVVGAAILFTWRSAGNKPHVTVDAGKVVPASTYQTRVVPAGSKEYANATYGFSLLYPQELSVTEYIEAADGHTISFDDPGTGEGLQIYVVPYLDPQITQSRILLDTNGTATGTVQEIVIGNNIHALHFSSYDPTRGALSETWFIHNNYLYEVTTFQELDSWLAEIMKSWQFL